MGKINVLDKQMAELIAAGEVIDRPASVIKELCENAIDAGATQIMVEIQRGGVTMMRITDNGSGIAPEDIRNAFVRHATSKLSIPEDLQNIMTMGFRGEALASVAAMCRVEVLTRTPGAAAGVRYCVEGGEECAFEETGCPEGTAIAVRDIFYNTPARMKFLKKDVAEAGAVGAAIDRMAAIHPRIAFRFIRDGKQVLSTPGNGRLSDAVYAVWGRDFFNTLVPAEPASRGARVQGYVSRPTEGRGNRGMQFFFVNDRPVRSGTCAAALEEAYRTSIMKGRFPACVLNLLLPPSVYDINVHPAKLEVRFADEKMVFDGVYTTVKSALSTLDKEGAPARMPTAPTFRPPSAPPSPPPLYAPPMLRQTPAALPDAPDVIPPPTAPPPARRWEPPPPEAPPAPEEEPAPPVPPPEAPPRRYEDARLIGELFKTYVLLECGERMILIDKHAAHERLLYERLKSTQEVQRQLLLTPAAVTLPKEEYAAVLQNLTLLARLGFGAEDFGDGCVIVREIPTMLDIGDARASVEEIAAKLTAGGMDFSASRLDDLYHTIACKAAIKAHDDTSPQELSALVGLLGEHEDVRFCPHGRPIATVFTRAQIERMFGRA